MDKTIVAYREYDPIHDLFSAIKEYDTISFEFTPQQIDEETFCSGGLTSDQMYALDWMVKE